MRFLFFSATKHNGLTLTERLVYSLAAKASRQYKSGISTEQLSRFTGLDRLRTVPQAIKRLEELGLVTKQDDRYLAHAPPEAVGAWFVPRSCKVPKHWSDKLAYFLVDLIHTSDQRQIDDVLLGLLQSFARQCQGLVSRQTPAGLAKLLGCERKRIRRALERLTEQGLILKDKSPIWGIDIKLVEPQSSVNGKPSQPVASIDQMPVPTKPVPTPPQHQQDRFSELRANRRCMLTLLEKEHIPDYLAGQIVGTYLKVTTDNALTRFTAILSDALEQHTPANDVQHCGHLLLDKCNTLVEKQSKEQRYWANMLDDMQTLVPA